jgi:tripartite-type tricarboxylate transporter receptor subunit TctC
MIGALSRASFITALALTVTNTSASAQTVEQFYKGREIEFISSGDAGTSYDTWARVLVRHWPKYIPGSPTIIVKNMPGGGHIIGTNHIYTIAPKDGSAIGIISDNIPLSSVLKNKPSLKADFTKMTFLGGTDSPNQVCVARPSAKVKKAEDLLTTEMTVGGAGAGSGVSIIPSFLKSVLGLKLNLIEGYKSSIEVMLAVDRGEVDGMCQTYAGVEHQRPGAMASGQLNLLFNVENDPIPGTKAPSVRMLVKNEEQRQVLDFYSLANTLGRPIVLPPGVPRDRVDALRRAFEMTTKDPEFLADAIKAKLDPNPTSGQEVERKFNLMNATPAQIIEKAVANMGT